jgi:hypothetical protein
VGAALTLIGVVAGFAQTPDVTIELEKATERSQRTRAQLEGLLQEYDLSPYIQTTRIIIEEGVIPHSHPVLTLNTAHLGDDLMLLSSFLGRSPTFASCTPTCRWAAPTAPAMSTAPTCT